MKVQRVVPIELLPKILQCESIVLVDSMYKEINNYPANIVCLGKKGGRVELCVTCMGSGRVTLSDEDSDDMRFDSCLDCNGYGVIQKGV